MSTRTSQILWFGRQVLIVILFSVLLTWIAAAPVVWIVRDGLGPGMVETSGLQSLLKFAGLWGIPFAVLAIPLAGLWLLEKRSQRSSSSEHHVSQ